MPYQTKITSARKMPIGSSDALKGLAIGVIIFFIGLAILANGLGDYKKSDNYSDLVSVFIGICFIAGAFYFYISIGQGQNDMETFKKGTALTVATIKDRYTKTDHGPYGGVDTTYYILIEFSVIDKIYQINAKVDNSLYEKTDREKSIRIKYSISNPCILLFESEYRETDYL